MKLIGEEEFEKSTKVFGEALVESRNESGQIHLTEFRKLGLKIFNRKIFLFVFLSLEV